MKRIFPAYGREMMQRRLGGEHPSPGELVLAAVGFWPFVGERFPAWPRRTALVVTDDMALGRLELRMLAGANVLAAFQSRRTARAGELIRLAWAVDPLSIVGLDFEAQWFFGFDAVRELIDCTESHRDYWQPLAAQFARAARRSTEYDLASA